MDAKSHSSGPPDPHTEAVTISEARKAAILYELEKILNSHAFRGTTRTKRFLSYVVKQTLEGHAELLKERSIGVEVFHRPASYSTGDDGVVRVKAGEVRRRLLQYYHEQGDSSAIRIELPVGSYVPEFHDNPTPSSIACPTPRLAANRRKLWLATVTALGLGVALALVLIKPRAHSGKSPESALDQFWSPVFATSQPVVICLAKPVLYRPSLDLYRRYSQAHPGSFQTVVERSNRVLPLDPNETLHWRDMHNYPDYGVGKADVYTAVQLSALFSQKQKASRVRIGDDFTSDDLRNSPCVLIGGYNNRWTLEMTSDLRFVFAEDDKRIWIEDRGPARRVWIMHFDPGPEGQGTNDFGVVTRLLPSKTGQVLIVAGGIAGNGMQAAGEFITTPDLLADGLRTAPLGWWKKNLQVVVETSVIRNVAGPPRVVATHFW
jgi:hypothetical protein